MRESGFLQLGEDNYGGVGIWDLVCVVDIEKGRMVFIYT